MPVPARKIDQASSSLQPVREVLALPDGVVEAHDVPAVDVAEHLDLPEFNDDGAVRVAAHRHTRLEQDVRARLRLRLALRVVRIRQARMQVRDVIRGLKTTTACAAPKAASSTSPIYGDALVMRMS